MGFQQNGLNNNNNLTMQRMSKIYYENWRDEAVLPMKLNIKACGVQPIPLKKDSKKQDGRLAIVHNGDVRKAALDQGTIHALLKSCLADNAIIIFTSTEGVAIEPRTLQLSTGLNYHVFGINRLPTGSPVSFLSVDEWKEIINWANPSSDVKSIDALKRRASETVIRMLWPGGREKRVKMALAVLCQGYLFCSTSQQNPNLIETVKSDWWLRVFVEREDNKALTVLEREKAMQVIADFLPQGGTLSMSGAADKFLSMLKEGKVNDAKTVSDLSSELAEELM